MRQGSRVVSSLNFIVPIPLRILSVFISSQMASTARRSLDKISPVLSVSPLPLSGPGSHKKPRLPQAGGPDSLRLLELGEVKNLPDFLPVLESRGESWYLRRMFNIIACFISRDYLWEYDQFWMRLVSEHKRVATFIFLPLSFQC